MATIMILNLDTILLLGPSDPVKAGDGLPPIALDTEEPELKNYNSENPLCIQGFPFLISFESTQQDLLRK